MAKIPAPRGAQEPDSNCRHVRTQRKGPFTAKVVTQEVRYYTVWCRKCGGYLRNEVIK